MYQVNDVIGKYQIVRTLGRGGMGVVYLARDTRLAREVAIKVINQNLEGADIALKRFQVEAQSIAQLKSQFIVHIYDYAPDTEQPYLVMEYIHGKALSEIIHTTAPMPAAAVVDCAHQVLSGLAAAHSRGIVHRDIKPANVLLGQEGIYKLMDFGLARSMEDDAQLTATGMLMGTLHYMAPELARGESASPQTDLYSLGIVIYQMLCGKVPFDEPSPLKLLRRIANERPEPIEWLRKDIPEPLAKWLAHLIEADPLQRTCGAKQALEELIATELDASSEEILPLISDEKVRFGTAPKPPQRQSTLAPSQQKTPGIDDMAMIESGFSNAVIEPTPSEPAAGQNTFEPDKAMTARARHSEAETAKRGAPEELPITPSGAIPLDEVDPDNRKDRELVNGGTAGHIATTLMLACVGFVMYYAGKYSAAPEPETPAPKVLLDYQEIPRPNVVGKPYYFALKPEALSRPLPRISARDHVLAVRVYEGGPVGVLLDTETIAEVDASYYDKPPRDGVIYLAAPRESRGGAAVLPRLRLGVLPFAAVAPSLRSQADALADEVQKHLRTADLFALRDLATIRARTHLQQAPINTTLRELARFHLNPDMAERLDAAFFVVGLLSRKEDECLVRMARVHADSGTFWEEVSATCAESELPAAAATLGRRLIERIRRSEVDRLFPADRR